MFIMFCQIKWDTCQEIVLLCSILIIITLMTTKKTVEQLRFAIVATDIVLLRNNGGVIEYATKIVTRSPHYDNVPGLLGGVLLPNEVSLDAAKRIIKEKSGIAETQVQFLPLGFYDAVDRDLRGRVVALAHVGIMEKCDEDYGLTWYPLFKKVHLAYDHNKMLEDTVAYLKSHMFVSVVALHFLPKTFVISDLKSLFDYVTGEVVDKRNFYKLLELFPIEATKELKSEGRGRPAQIYKKKAFKGFFLR